VFFVAGAFADLQLIRSPAERIVLAPAIAAMTLPDELQSKARRLAMLKAVEQLEGRKLQVCGKCNEREERHSGESRIFCEEIQHLRSAAQKMLDQLAAYMSRPSLRAFAKAMQLDDRLFVVPGDFDTYRCVPFPVEEAISHKALEQVIAERDIAKMKLSVVSKEIKELKAAAAKEARAPAQVPAEIQRRLDEVEQKLQTCAGQLRSSTALEANSDRASAEVLKAKISAFEEDCKGHRTSASQRANRGIDGHAGGSSSRSREENPGGTPKKQAESRLERVEDLVEDLDAWCKRRPPTPPAATPKRVTGTPKSHRAEGRSTTSLSKAMSAGDLRALEQSSWKGSTTLPTKCFIGPDSPAASPMLSARRGRGSSRLVLFPNEHGVPGLLRST